MAEVVRREILFWSISLCSRKRTNITPLAELFLIFTVLIIV
jgi:hypothetical protein